MPFDRQAWHKRHNEDRRKRLDELKLERGCIRCGYKEHPRALQFDHRDPKAKRFVVGKSKRRWEDIRAEIDKCDVRCANCHAIHTYEQRRNGIAAGGRPPRAKRPSTPTT
ncbi:MAG: hypothetical protein ACRENE_22135 [Polyangiaceae bacterium]